MIWQYFYQEAVKQDDENKFDKNTTVSDLLPDILKELYLYYDPVDVEVAYQGNGMRFIPYSELNDYQAEYEMPEDALVFATCNSNPFFFKEGKVYTKAHDDSKAVPELISENMEEFILLLFPKNDEKKTYCL